MRRSLPVALVGALLLAGCATAPEIPFDHGAAAPIKTIGLVTPRFPSGPSVVLASTVGQSFGLIGFAIDASLEANRESKFKAVLEQQHFSAQQVFVERVTAALEQAGYTVVTVPLERDRDDFAAHYPDGIEHRPDAFLDLVVKSYGYTAAGVASSTPYRPVFALRARLVSARDSSVLMQDAVVYNPIGPADKTITIAPEPAYQFVNFDTLLGQSDTALKGLRAAAEQSADAVGQLLR
jgi:hypothetical protein